MEQLFMKGTINIDVLDENYKVIRKVYVENIITNSGIDTIMKILYGKIPGHINKLGIGLDNTKEEYTDTQLYNKLTEIELTATNTSNTISFKALFPKNHVDKNYWIKEIGLLCDDGTLQYLVTRAVLDSEKEIFITPKNSLILTYQITFVNSI